MFRIRGGRRLEGEIRVKAAKNAVLPMLACSIMTGDEIILKDCPRLADIENMRLILSALGADTKFEGGTLSVRASNANQYTIPPCFSGKLRSSVFMMGPLIARFRRAAVAYPGGCDIGERPIDLHLKGLRALGVSICERNGIIELDGAGLKPGEVLMDFPSVGATENIMMAASSVKGRSVILNAACEPEIRDLADMLVKMGARVEGAGTGRITIDGTDSLKGCVHTPIPDRIAAGTFLCAAAITGGEIAVTNVVYSDNDSVIGKLREMGCEISSGESAVLLKAPKRLKPANLQTQPYPGFPTDMQAQMTALLATAEGTGVITENIFENRLAHVCELRKMGASISVFGRNAVVNGKSLRGARVSALNLRAGAALTLAALSAEGISEVTDVHYIDRGYEAFDKALNALGADIERTKA